MPLAPEKLRIKAVRVAAKSIWSKLARIHIFLEELMIKSMTPGKIIVEVGYRTATIQGEALVPGIGTSDYVVYVDTLVFWDSPYQDERISSSQKNEIINGVKADLATRNTRFEIDGAIGYLFSQSIRTLL